MSGLGSSSQALSSGNVPQAQQAPQQHDPIFKQGQAFFARLQENGAQEYKNFKKLDTTSMFCLTDAL